MQNSEALRRQALVLLEQANKIDAQPQDDFSPGDVITWNAQYGRNVNRYRWVAIKLDNGRWATSGRYGDSTDTWDSLWEKMQAANKDGIWYVAEWKELMV